MIFVELAHSIKVVLQRGPEINNNFFSGSQSIRFNIWGLAKKWWHGPLRIECPPGEITMKSQTKFFIEN